MHDAEIKRHLAAVKKSLDGFLKDSGFPPEAVLRGKSYEQFFRDYEAKLRQHAQNPQ
jgi:hypothetical protein